MNWCNPTFSAICDVVIEMNYNYLPLLYLHAKFFPLKSVLVDCGGGGALGIFPLVWIKKNQKKEIRQKLEVRKIFFYRGR
jgi:hypothetical protein